MNKILIEICVPAADVKFNSFVAPTTKGIDVVNIMKSIFSSMYEGKFEASEDSTICVYNTGKLLDINKSMYEQNIINGSKLVLI